MKNRTKMRKDTDADSKQRKSKHQKALKQNSAHYVLLVEDNPIALKILEYFLKRDHFRYCIATDSTSALEKAQDSVFDVIITDIGLPDFSGIELTKKIRDLEQQQQRLPVPIIGLTAHMDTSHYKVCIDAGINDVFMKPITDEIWQHLKSHYIG